MPSLPDASRAVAGGLGGLGGLVSALLSSPNRPDPSRLPAPGDVDLPAPEVSTPPPAPTLAPFLTGPTGLGTSAARLAVQTADGRSRPVVVPSTQLPGGPSDIGRSTWWIPGGFPEEAAETSTTPELFCPGAVRDDPALGAEVNDRLVDWAEEIGIYPGRLDRLRAYDFGRLIMLAHPGSDDPDRLLAAAKCILAEWVADDYYVDEVELGADPRIVGSRVALLHAVVDPAQLPVQYAPQLEEYKRREPIAIAFRTAREHLARFASVPQVARFQHQMGILFVAWNQEADWHRNGRTPPVWEYLAHRHINNFLPPMLLVDPVAGYELPPSEYFDPRVRRAFTMAGHAGVLVNDLHSAAFESDTDFNLPRVIAAEDKCSQEEAIRRTVEIHNELMHTFVSEASLLSLTGSPMLQRFFVDTWAWLGGSREWHASSSRYQHGGRE